MTVGAFRTNPALSTQPNAEAVETLSHLEDSSSPQISSPQYFNIPSFLPTPLSSSPRLLTLLTTHADEFFQILKNH